MPGCMFSAQFVLVCDLVKVLVPGWEIAHIALNRETLCVGLNGWDIRAINYRVCASSIRENLQVPDSGSWINWSSKAKTYVYGTFEREPFVRRRRIMRTVAIVTCFVLLIPFTAWTQTFISGNISGTWSSTGNPFIVSGDCNVPNGQVLTIEPGVSVIIGENIQFIVNGRISAIGTSNQPIVFDSPNDTSYWNRIYVYYRRGNGTSKFEYCEVNNASTGIYLSIQGQTNHVSNETMRTEIRNCSFSNCLSYGIYGNSEGETICQWPPGRTTFHTYLNPVIRNCTFDSTVVGIAINVHGERHPCGANASFSSYGHASPSIQNNLFRHLTGTVLDLRVGSYAASSNPVFVNNTIVDCFRGLYVREPYDAQVKNNVFCRTAIGVQRSGGLSDGVDYNCFYDSDSTYFIGYGSVYGDTVWTNNNGIPCDLRYNIYRDPQYADVIDFCSMDIRSQCVDAGDDDTTYNDLRFPPSLGLVTNDIGITGGPHTKDCLATGIHNSDDAIVSTFELGQNYPNPFNPETRIEFTLPRRSMVVVTIYNLLGQQIRQLVNQEYSAGNHKVTWDGKSSQGVQASTGIYFYRLKAGSFVETKKMVLLK